jgi:hypothetical protein
LANIIKEINNGHLIGMKCELGICTVQLCASIKRRLLVLVRRTQPARRTHPPNPLCSAATIARDRLTLALFFFQTRCAKKTSHLRSRRLCFTDL